MEDLTVCALALFTLLVVLYHICHKEYDKQNHTPKENDEDENEFEKLSSKVYQMDQLLQSHILKIENIELCTNTTECLEMLDRQEDEEIYNSIKDRLENSKTITHEELIQRLNRNKKMSREPTHPGVFLKDDYLTPLNLTYAHVAKLIYVDVEVIEDLINKKICISVILALKLSILFKTSLEFWIDAQLNYDLWLISSNNRDEINLVKPFEEVV
ncbi:MAG: HigA family addiction module antidote protein [Helicobacteraceae bacterium]|nr:HigA family addiction module antidote protein [Helicobacteraceae bacterium]